MPGLNLLVIADPNAPYLKVLQKLPPNAKTTISLDETELLRAAPDADVILNCTGHGPQLRAVFPKAQKVQWIHSLAAGVEHQLFPELVESPIPLTNARGVYRESLGEFVIAAALFFAKDFRRMLRQQSEHKWEKFMVDEISRQTMGVVGYGEIGKAAASRGKSLGMRILGTSRKSGSRQSDEIADQLFPLEKRGDMIAQSDVVVVSVPLTQESRGLVGAAEIARMKPNAIIVNVGRGPVIDEKALVEALSEKRIRGAALDVFDEEPLPQDHPLWSLDNVLISPHTADNTCDWLEQSTEFFVTNFERFVSGRPLLNVVDKHAGY